MDEQQAWAKGRLLNLAESLLPNGHEIAHLRAASVSPTRIETLYPFASSEWSPGISDLTNDAEWLPDAQDLDTYGACEREAVKLLTASWSNTYELSGALAKEWRTKELAEAWAAAIDDRNPSLTPYILSFTVLLLAALAANRAHPKAEEIPQQLWREHLREFRIAVNQLVELLQDCNWQCAAQRKSRNGSGKAQLDSAQR